MVNKGTLFVEVEGGRVFDWVWVATLGADAKIEGAGFLGPPKRLVEEVPVADSAGLEGLFRGVVDPGEELD